jgi:hypothetical protein
LGKIKEVTCNINTKDLLVIRDFITVGVQNGIRRGVREIVARIRKTIDGVTDSIRSIKTEVDLKVLELLLELEVGVDRGNFCLDIHLGTDELRIDLVSTTEATMFERVATRHCR